MAKRPVDTVGVFLTPLRYVQLLLAELYDFAALRPVDNTIKVPFWILYDRTPSCPCGTV